ncbi:MAG: hypothetical protein FWG73_05090 [Planctomycetaceae bacterium]|nr:hypothetical protein [Planctomycetaceae bacterium]
MMTTSVLIYTHEILTTMLEKQSDVATLKGLKIFLPTRCNLVPLISICCCYCGFIKMGALRDEDVYVFLQKGAFALYSIDLDDETVEHEFLDLLDEGYLRETNSAFFLESKGKRVAEKLYTSDFCLDGTIEKLRGTVAVLEKLLQNLI